ncbi:glycosyltransferase family 39 protein [Candidatus Roizmanbacteria bacterium]|nr:glycosyltransferase family 39 protein [Candidatus Roizmanbacteria bacterium]
MKKEPLLNLLRSHFPVILFLIIYTLLIGWKLTAHPAPFYDWDEAIYAQVGREMVMHRSVIPLWQGANWLDKPPLAPLAYGVVETIAPLSPEISTRLFTLALSAVTLILAYVLYLRLSRDKIIALLTVIITGFVPIFVQRTQVLNVDIFLLLGWLGYLVFYEDFWPATVFLAVGVLSKSLLGFYPVGLLFLYYIFEHYYKKRSRKYTLSKLKPLLWQVLILAAWYLAMTAIFRGNFIKYHFFDSHFKRVTASIESHFGKRTFYLDLLFSQMGWILILTPVSLLFIVKKCLKTKNIGQLAFSLFFVPWFIFLNLTKTKIAWYLYPLFPQFAYLGISFLEFIKKNRPLYTVLIILIVVILFYQNIIKTPFFKGSYSGIESNIEMARYAASRCKQLEVLIDPDTRKTHAVLKSMNLLISTSEWWGNHPSIVYYSGRHVDFIYNPLSVASLAKNVPFLSCFVFYKGDSSSVPSVPSLSLLKDFGGLTLYQKNEL